MRLVFGRDQELAEWVMRRVPRVNGFGLFSAIGLERDGKIKAAVIYHNYTPLPGGGNIEITMASDGPMWARRENIRALLHYPFEQLKCHRITVVIPKRNKPSRKINAHLGFRLEGNIRRGFGDDDAIVMGMLRSEAVRWLENGNG